MFRRDHQPPGSLLGQIFLRHPLNISLRDVFQPGFRIADEFQPPLVGLPANQCPRPLAVGFLGSGESFQIWLARTFEFIGSWAVVAQIGGHLFDRVVE